MCIRDRFIEDSVPHEIDVPLTVPTLDLGLLPPPARYRAITLLFVESNINLWQRKLLESAPKTSTRLPHEIFVPLIVPTLDHILVVVD